MIIVKIPGTEKYFLWSTVCDAPATKALTLEELKEEIQIEDGENGLRKLPERLERVEKNGVSSMISKSPRDLMFTNRAGKDGARLELEEIYRMVQS